MNTFTPEFELDDDGAYTRLAVRQSAHPDRPTLRRHRVGVGMYDEVEGRLVRRTYLEIDVSGELSEITEAVGEKQPDLLLLNDDDLAYVKIRLDERSLATAIDGLSKLDDSLARALVWGAAWDMTRDAELSATDFVELVLANVGTETDSWGITRIPTYAAQSVSSFSDPAAPRRAQGTVGGRTQGADDRCRAGQRLPAHLRAHLRRRRPVTGGRSRTSSTCSTVRWCSRASASTRTCAGSC